MEDDFLDALHFEKAAEVVIGRGNTYGTISNIRRFRACFGTSPSVCSIIWALISDELPDNKEPMHLLIALNFLKTYSTESIRSVLFRVDEKTLRERQWNVIESIASLKLVSTTQLHITCVLTFIFRSIGISENKEGKNTTVTLQLMVPISVSMNQRRSAQNGIATSTMDQVFAMK